MGATARFRRLLPALLLALACLRVAEFLAGLPAGMSPSVAAWTLARGAADDALGLLRYLPALLVLSLPALLVRSRLGRVTALGVTWSVLVLAQACLVAYFLAARVLLGADLYAYSADDIRTIAFAGPRLSPWLVGGTALGLAVLWRALLRRSRDRRPEPAPRALLLWCAIGLATFAFGPAQLPPARGEGEYARSLRLSKAPSFVDSTLAYLGRPRPGSGARVAPPPTPTATAGHAPSDATRPQSDPRYPFLHPERTPDVLGPLFTVDAATRPNLVFVIVEGLGRSFSGPEATLGSFTPFLDELAQRSLYFENALAPQGRTFGVLPSLLGSLPFAEQGFAALGPKMPEHATLLSVLKSQGYRLRYFGGTDSAFDDERTFLERQGVEALFDRSSFGPSYPRSNEWGYDDGELVSFALAEEARDDRQPFVDVIQTITMHDPFRFLGEASYRARVGERLEHLAIPAAQRPQYLEQGATYAAILYTDDALRRYFASAAQRPSYRNTIFILTGDHRLPELPLAEWIDRYHVPLIIYSPLLKAPRRVRAVSSHFDIAPSLLALLSHGYGLRTPAAVTWLGSGLDLQTSFRNVHDVPMKQTKVNLVDFVSGEWLLSRGMLYRLRDGLHMEPASDSAAQAVTAARFESFLAANASFARSLELAPPGTFLHTAGYAEHGAGSGPGSPGTPSGVLAVRELSAPERARAGELAIDVEIENGAREASGPFVPLVVLSYADGSEYSESYGASLTLQKGQRVTLHLPVRTAGAAAGRYYLSVYPADPANGKRLGQGRFHIPLVIDDRAVPGALP